MANSRVVTRKVKHPGSSPAGDDARKPSLLGVAPPPVNVEERLRRGGPSPRGVIAARVYRCFIRIRDKRRIPEKIPRIARSLRLDEDHVWDLFVWYVRGADKLPLA